MDITFQRESPPPKLLPFLQAQIHSTGGNRYSMLTTQSHIITRNAMNRVLYYTLETRINEYKDPVISEAELKAIKEYNLKLLELEFNSRKRDLEEQSRAV